MSEPQSTGLHVKLFGGPRLLRDGEEVSLSPFQSYLIALVYGHGPRGLSQSKAAWLLWERDDDPEIRHRLRQLVYTIGRKAGCRLIRRIRGQLLPNGPEVTSDWIRGSSIEPPRMPLNRRGEFLELLPTELPTKALDDWVRAAKVQQRRLYMRLLRERLEQARSLSNPSETHHIAALLLELAPTDESALMALTRSVIVEGNAREAQKELKLRTEMARLVHPDWSPPREIIALIDQALDTSGPDIIPSEPEFVGRGSELRRAVESLLEASVGWHTVVLSGEPGIGKTRLLDEIGRRLVLHGNTIVSARCYETEREISFNLIGEILEDSRLRQAGTELDEPWRAIARAVFPSFATCDDSVSTPAPEYPVANTRAVHDTLEQLFTSVTRREGLVLLIDDFQWIDSSSASALSFLRRRLSRQEVSLILTVATDTISEDHAAAPFLRALDGDRDTWHVLEPLPPSEITTLLSRAFPNRLSDEQQRSIAAVSMGVPLFALEIAEDRLEGGHSDPGPGLTTTRSAEALFRRRQRGLSNAARHLLAVVAVVGRPISYEDLKACADLPDARYLRALEDLQKRRLISAKSNAVEVRHQVIRGAVYGSLSAPTRRTYHRTVAQFLEKRQGVIGAAELAVHFCYGGLPRVAHSFAIKASEEAAAKGGFEHARKMLELAVATSEGAQERFSCLHRLGTLCVFRGHHSEAVVHFELAAQTAEAVNETRRATEAQLAALRARLEAGEVDLVSATRGAASLTVRAEQLGDTHLYLSALDLSLRVADYTLDAKGAANILRTVDSVDTTSASPAAKCLREASRTRHICYGDPGAAVVAARAALGIAEANGLREAFGQAVKRFIVVLSYRGLLDGQEGRRQVEAAKSAFQETGDQCGMFDVLINYGAWLSDTGRYSEARGYFEEAGGIVRDLEDSPEYTVYACNMGEFELYQRDYLSAKQFFRDAWDRRSSTRPAASWVAAAGLGLCALETGDLRLVEEAEAALPVDALLLENLAFDPTPIALFRARRLDLQRRPGAAMHLLEQFGKALRNRILPAWLKIQLAQCDIQRKHRLGPAEDLAREAQMVARELGLGMRARDFDRYIG